MAARNKSFQEAISEHYEDGKIEVQYIGAEKPFVLNTRATLGQMKARCPLFFENGKAFGRNETHTVYKGQLICQIDTEFGDQTVRKTVVYLFREEGMFCLGSGPLLGGNPVEEMERAKAAIDETLQTGQYQQYR